MINIRSEKGVGALGGLLATLLLLGIILHGDHYYEKSSKLEKEVASLVQEVGELSEENGILRSSALEIEFESADACNKALGEIKKLESGEEISDFICDDKILKVQNSETELM